MYVKQYNTETEYQVIEYYQGGSRIISHNQHDYLEWVALGNIPTVEAAGRFLSVVNGVLVVDPNKASILAAEEAARVVEQQKQAAKAQALIDNLPSWQAVSDAIDAADTVPKLRAIVKKIARVTYWIAKNSAI
jgi:F0F1-type ATP synthase epsilon subunit